MKKVKFACRIRAARLGGVIAACALALTAGLGRSAVAAPAETEVDGIFGGSFESIPNDPVLGLGPCLPSGSGHDYQVGHSAGQLSSLDQVPWENLAAGDTVRIFYSATPYKGKFAINGYGTANAPVRVCGVKGPNGERPIIDGSEATSRPTMSYGRNSASAINQSRGIIMVVTRGQDDATNQPTYVQIDGLKIERAQPAYGYYDTSGQHQSYMEFGACIWIERGHHVTIADNDISDCSQAIFSRSLDGGGDPYITRDVRLVGNVMYDTGVAGSYLTHTTYIQSIGATYEFNYYGAMRPGAIGNSIKDRSVGTVVRYNRIEAGAYAIDLVEAEDYPDAATADPAYRTAYVYGNQIVKDGSLVMHYGGDHVGNEPIYRKGTLYFWNNTVYLTHADDIGAYVFRLATTEETAEVWNNVFIYSSSIQYPSLRTSQDVAPGYTTGGVVNMGVNWIDQRWGDSDPYHPVPGELNGTNNFIVGTPSPVDLQTLIPIANGEAVDTAQPQPAAVSQYPVTYQLDAQTLVPEPREVHGTGMDLGAVER